MTEALAIFYAGVFDVQLMDDNLQIVDPISIKTAESAVGRLHEHS